MGIVVFQQTPSYIKFKPFNENPFWAFTWIGNDADLMANGPNKLLTFPSSALLTMLATFFEGQYVFDFPYTVLQQQNARC